MESIYYSETFLFSTYFDILYFTMLSCINVKYCSYIKMQIMKICRDKVSVIVYVH